APGGAQVDSVTLNATVKEGRAELTGLQVKRTGNQLDLTAQAELPADPALMAQTPWKATLKSTLPQVTDFLAQPPPLKGTLALNATAEGQGATPLKAAGELTGQTLEYGGSYRLP